MKFLIISIFLMGVTLTGFTKSNDVADVVTETEYLGSVPEDHSYTQFYGYLSWYYTQSGALVIVCDPPFIPKCYGLFWSIGDERGVILNDGYDTEISVSSDPIITIDENGNEVHTFTIN